MQREIIAEFRYLILKKRSDIFRAKFLNVQVLMVVTLCSLVNSYCHLEVWLCLHHQCHALQKEKRLVNKNIQQHVVLILITLMLRHCLRTSSHLNKTCK